MKLTGHPSHVGETRYQFGYVAKAVKTPTGPQWDVIGGGRLQRTERLSHVSHWLAKPRSQTVPRVTGREVAPLFLTTGAPVSAVFYPDCSNNNWHSVQDALNFCALLVPQGFAGMCHKISEGNYYGDPYGAPVQQWCEQNNMPFLGFHYVTLDDPASQVDTWKANGGGDIVMFDWEANSGNFANYQTVAAAFTAAGITPHIGYCPDWYFNSVGGGDLSTVPVLISSAYPTLQAGYASTLYDNGGGDGGEGWNAYGNQQPAIWQFTDAAMIGGWTVDCNAFRGTPDDLAAIFNGGTVSQATDIKDVQEQLRGPDLNGWAQLGGHTIVDALALIGQKLEIPGFAPPA